MGARVVLVVSGGIAAYKAPELVRALHKAGCTVQVVTTDAAAAFVTELSLATVSGRPVRSSLLDPDAEGRVGHIEIADWAQLVVVAPATADLMARAAAGLADDLATTVLLATRAPVLWAPAMNTNMWRHPATREATARLAARGGRFVGPDRGELACGWIGEGRMIDPPIIVDAALSIVRGASSLAGRRVLVSAGPTRTYVDPVRFLTNASTGAMGFAIAEVAAQRGAEVALVAGPVERATPPGVRRIDVDTADAMLTAMSAELTAAPCDLVAMVAAVADLAAAPRSPVKLAKDDLLARLSATAWTRGVDVLQTLLAAHRDRGFFLGFAAETLAASIVEPDEVAQALVAAARAKLYAKGCDAVFVNRVGVADTGFATPTNTGHLVLRDRDADAIAIDAGPPVAKHALAGWILDRVAEHAWGSVA